MRFVVVGGVAAALQGSAYVTEDIDIVYARDGDNLARLVAALSPFEPRLRVRGEPLGLPFLFDVATLERGLNFTLTTTIGDIDILGVISGVGGYAEALASSEQVFAVGEDVGTAVLSLAGLIAAKRAANRTKDRLILPELEAMLELRELEPPE